VVPSIHATVSGTITLVTAAADTGIIDVTAIRAAVDRIGGQSAMQCVMFAAFCSFTGTCRCKRPSLPQMVEPRQVFMAAGTGFLAIVAADTQIFVG
jgi:hypothetical protein